MLHIIELTEDGSHTLYIPELNEHYHSTHGAVQESLHVYLEAGLHHYDKQEVNLLEIGFGTGLNAFLTLLDTERSGKTVKYTTLERYPVSLAHAEKLNYSKLLDPSRKEIFIQLHSSAWGDWVDITPTFGLKKLQTDALRLEEFQPEALFDLIYYDAFAPEKQPGMWTEEIFNRLYALSNYGAMLTTYCAKGAVRRMLQTAGYRVERLPGPPGKREILRAVK
ncbi:tRNA (5-methylaminomethyl-2-thiouridine)(34)-methyltransferase MnmD [uncultured Proteiniphilum sp.]|uniref:tRNA (5-methylaminomethyl-2-thiouridine)(34)-methyltransferase MnmD n=1 Tax=uncultured Proteiniphilum sp. TaxID=497637 RepID=UPI002619C76E|nr:tRNA (5-methylaminomethyl-2-thiouridine)(34)-methyltransferase MnmD [uncultured Proteiniphilum sp.]